MASREQVLEKVKKLMALAGDVRGNVNETASAAEAAQRLMFQFKIEMSELEVEAEAAEPITDTDLLAQLGQKSTMSWQVILANALARANFCRCIITPWSSWAPAKLQVFGKPGDVKAATYLFMAVTNQIHERCRAWQASEKRVWGYGPDKAASNSFRYGAAQAVAARVSSARRQEEQKLRDCSSSTALVRVEKADSDVDAWISETFKKTKAYTPGKPSTRDGYAEGVAAGHRIDLGGARNALKSQAAALTA